MLCVPLFFACEKKDLVEYSGPQGEPGDNGEQGAAGRGFDIIYKEFTVYPSDWSKNRYTLIVPELTEKYRDAGLTMVYVEQDKGWYPLPFRFYDAAYWSQNFQFMVGEGAVQLIHASNFVSPPLLSYQFKLVAAAEPGAAKNLLLDYINSIEEIKVKQQL